MNRFTIPKMRYVFNRRHTATTSKAKEGKTAPIELEIYHDGKRKWLPTGIHIYTDQWIGESPYFVVRHPQQSVINQILNDNLESMSELVNNACREGDFSLASLSVYIKQQEDQEKTFLEFFEERNNERLETKEITYETWRSMKMMLDHVRKCGRIISFSDLTPANIQCFDDYLHRIGQRQTTIYKTHKKLKVYIHECLRRGFIKQDPYENFAIKIGKSLPKRFLTEEEMNAVRNIELNERRLGKVRDLAVFQMFTGLAYADLYKFDFGTVEVIDGNYFVRDQRKKNGEMFTLLLLTPAVDVLKKYSFVLPQISNQKYNAYLKELAGLCGIPAFTSHALRRTYATFALSKGMGLEILARTMGHTNTHQTREYAKLLGNDVLEAMNILNQKIKGV